MKSGLLLGKGTATPASRSDRVCLVQSGSMRRPSFWLRWPCRRFPWWKSDPTLRATNTPEVAATWTLRLRKSARWR